MKNKYLLIFFLTIFLFLLSSGFCWARVLEVEYPSLPGAPEVTFLPQYIKYMFNLGIAIAGVIALLALVVGGFRYMTSAGKPETKSDAKNQIFAGLFGLIILLSSYLILTTINPELKKLKTPILIGLPGVKLVSDVDKKDCPVFVEDTEAPEYQPYHTIEYICTKEEAEEGAIIRVYFYTQTDFGGTASKVDLDCGDTMPKSGKSFIYVKLTPGVYLYTENNCAPTFPPPSPQTGPLPALGENWNKKIRSIEVFHNFVEDNPTHPKSFYYDVILHGETNYKGACQHLMAGGPPKIKCINIQPFASSVFIYKYPLVPYLKPPDGEVTFFSRPYYIGGRFIIQGEEINPNYPAEGPAKSLAELVLNYFITQPGIIGMKLPLAPLEEQAKYKTFYDSPGSISVSGDYFILFWSKEGVCQVFTENVPNLKHLEWITNEGRWPTSVYISVRK